MNALVRFSRGETNYDFVGRRNRWFLLSGVLLLASVIALATLGLDLGLEFKGGTAVTAENLSGATEGDYQTLLEDLGLEGSRVQIIGEVEGGLVRIQTKPLDSAGQDALADGVAALSGSPRLENSIEATSSSFGADVLRKGIKALVWFMIFVLIFISIRLQFKMAIAGIVALLHDLLITVGVYSITGFSVTPATLIAFLTIMSYSLYDTVVVFDKVKELEKGSDSQTTYSGIVNRALNMVLFRSISTSLTSLFPVGSLLFVGSILFGAASLRDFALALFVGMLVGTYSSLFIAGVLLARWKEREDFWVERRTRIEKRSATSGQPVEAVGASAKVRSDAPKVSSGAVQAPKSVGSAPRPPKKKKR